MNAGASLLALNMETQYKYNVYSNKSVVTQVPTDNGVTPYPNVPVASAKTESVQQPIITYPSGQVTSRTIAPTEPNFTNRIQIFPCGGLFANRFEVDSSGRMIVSGEWSPEKFQNESTNTTVHIPKIKIRTLKELQEPSIYEKTEQNKLELRKTCTGSNTVQAIQADVIAKYVDATSLKHIPCKIQSGNTLSSNEIYQHAEKPILKPVEHTVTQHHLKVQKKENLLKERLLNLQKKQDFLRSISNRNIRRTWPLHCLETSGFVDLSNANCNLSSLQMESENISTASILNIQKKQDLSLSVSGSNTICNTWPMCSLETGKFLDLSNVNCDLTLQQTESENTSPRLIIQQAITHEETKENKEEDVQESNEKSGTQAEEVHKEVDVTGLKEGIIEASRTLINTQKTLKGLGQIVSSDISFKNEQAVKLITKFQSVLKSFRKGINEIDKTVKSQYKHLIPNNDIDLILESIKSSMPPRSPKTITRKYRKRRIKQPEIVPNRRRCVGVSKRDAERNTTESSDDSEESSSKMSARQVLNPLSSSNNWQEHSVDESSDEGNTSKINNYKKVKFRVISKSELYCKRRRLSRVCKLIEEENTETFPKRVIPPRSCRKSQTCVVYDVDEYEFEEDS